MRMAVTRHPINTRVHVRIALPPCRNCVGLIGAIALHAARRDHPLSENLNMTHLIKILPLVATCTVPILMMVQQMRLMAARPVPHWTEYLRDTRTDEN